MPFSSKVIRVLIASPSDLSSERSLVEQKLYRWNRMWSEKINVNFQPVMWEHSSHPGIGRGQDVLNRQILETADVIVAFIGGTLGTPTGNYPSGTVEEISTGEQLGKIVHVWFGSDRYYEENQSADPNDWEATEAANRELVRVNDYKKSLRDAHLYGSFNNGHDLADQIESALLDDLNTQGWQQAPSQVSAMNQAMELAVPLRKKPEREHVDAFSEQLTASFSESLMVRQRKAKELGGIYSRRAAKDWVVHRTSVGDWVLTNQTGETMTVMDYRLSITALNAFNSWVGNEYSPHEPTLVLPGDSFVIICPNDFVGPVRKAEAVITYKRAKQRTTAVLKLEGPGGKLSFRTP